VKYFKAFELVDHLTYESMGENALSLFDAAALQALDDLREYFDRPVTVNDWHSGGEFEWRGFRTLAKAIELGAPRSAHATGRAFDLDILGLSAEAARLEIMANKNNPLLMRIMRLEAGKNWVHFDVMELPPWATRIHLFTA
jgi:hypothetical protein